MAAEVVQGHYAARFSPLHDLFESLIVSGRDVGASLAVTIDGETVVDLWGGWTDAAKTKPWQSDTIINVWSSTKPMVSLVALMLADRGEINLDDPVARYWPEFAANGKGGVRVRHLLSHSSGVPGWEQPMVTEDLYDWDKCTAGLAAQAPWWQPGTATGYHALNYGFLIGEVMRRVTGMKPGELFAKEVAAPLKADFHIGLADREFQRVANVIPPEVAIDVSQIDPSTVTFRTLSNPPPNAPASSTPEWRRADIGACNGHGNARSLAQVQAVVANDGVAGGKRLLSPRMVSRIFELQNNGIDLVLGLPVRMGLGYGLPHPQLTPFIPEGRCAFWGGWGGSIVLADADRRMTVSYVMNKMEGGTVGGTNAAELVACAYNIFGV
ncbi:serine hydrolase domain-containing protein [Ramlibacter sp. PS4R-6]|uniref:serine hydrolase domain-containing protein n=1 Tax=Ramlibacter sp. PS4R-6 TaxID=3133438 RepID=UPI0030ADC84D